MGFFDTAKRSFKDVTITDGKINTTEFLEAAETVVDLFGVLGSAAFTPVTTDMNNNIKKIRERQTSHPGPSGTLQDLCANELGEKKHTATEGLLWLNRGLEFTAKALRQNVGSTEELAASFTSAYEQTLKKHHNMLVKGVFGLAMKACPYRDDFYKKLGDDQVKVKQQLEEWLTALENIVRINNGYIPAKF